MATGRIIIIGYGTIGQCALPLLIDRMDRPAGQFVVIDRIAEPAMLAPFRQAGLTYLQSDLNRETFAAVMAGIARAGDLLINLTIGIDSLELADWCHAHGIAYVDTALEPWDGFVADADQPVAERTEYALHQRARRHAETHWRRDGPTAIVTHGANPGMVNHFAKAALVEVAGRMGIETDTPDSREGWARLARRTGTKVIHISERDTQVSPVPRQPGEFVNTWSIPGFIEEAMMPVEFGWGSHERTLPPGALRHSEGPGNTIYLDQAAARYLLYSWVPSHGQILGLAIPHSEMVTLSDYLTVIEDGVAVYRPTVSFVYLPCDAALASLHETMMGGWREPVRERVLKEDISAGHDELGVLLLGHDSAGRGRTGLWYGSHLDIDTARAIVPHSNPTALQVAAGVVSASLWAAENPARGYCEPEDLPHDFVLAAARPYLGRMMCVETDWTPLGQRSFLDAPAAPDDPWQFANFRPGL